MRRNNKIYQWNKIHSVLFCFLFILYTVVPVRYPLIIAGGISFLLYGITHFQLLKAYKPFAGYANRVTLFRLILVMFSGIFYKNLPDFILFTIGIGFFCLDGLDGFIARKLNQISEFGIYFDIETDAFYVCVFSVILFEKGFVGYWILIPGFMRYFYGIVTLLFGPKVKEEQRTKYGPLVAGIFFVSILSPFILTSTFYTPVLIFSSALLMLSFLNSFIRIFSIRKI